MIRFNRIQGNIFQITSRDTWYVAIWTGLHLFRSFSVWLFLLCIFEITYLYRKKNFEKPLLEKLGKFLRLCLKWICATMLRQERPPFLALELQCIFVCAKCLLNRSVFVIFKKHSNWTLLKNKCVWAILKGATPARPCIMLLS